MFLLANLRKKSTHLLSCRLRHTRPVSLPKLSTPVRRMYLMLLFPKNIDAFIRHYKKNEIRCNFNGNKICNYSDFRVVGFHQNKDKKSSVSILICYVGSYDQSCLDC